MNKQVAMAMPPEARAAKMFFDHNKNRYDFLAESCWARMQWMVPHLVPHGLFMKLSLEPLPSLPDEIVAEDGRFWDTSEKDILNSNASASDPWLRTQYADCRSNIAEMYLCRNMTREAEAAYRQALRLNPTQANAAFNLSWHILAPAGKTEEAISILSKLAKESPSALVRDNAKKVIDRLSNQPSAIGAPNAPQPQR
jgi:tetratricopeptide (TPR) repeat protein